MARRRRKSCKYGVLKSWTKTGKGRKCRKCPKGAFKRCRYGRLKNPVGKRICKKRPG